MTTQEELESEIRRVKKIFKGFHEPSRTTVVEILAFANEAKVSESDKMKQDAIKLLKHVTTSTHN